MENGAVMERGTHEDLMRRPRVYYDSGESGNGVAPGRDGDEVLR